MNQDIIKSLNLELGEIMRGAEAPAKKLIALDGLKTRMEILLSKSSVEYKHLMTVICEISGNQYLLDKQAAEAEKQYRQMMRFAAELYQKDPKRFDLLLAQANFRMGVFYKDLLKVRAIMPQPVQLTDKQKPIYDMCIKLFQTTVQAILEKVKAGNPAAVEMQIKAMSCLMLLRAVVGDYQESEKIGIQLVKVGKALFQVNDDVPHALALSESMIHLATVYTIQKEFVKAMELHEDCIYVLEDKKEQNLQLFGIRIATEYMNLGNVCALIPEEKEAVRDHYQKAISLVEKLNQMFENKYANEEKQMRVIIEHYEKREKLSPN